MGRDELGTLRQLKASRAAMSEEIARHRGRVFNTADDSLLVEFGSVVYAVECAVRLQRGLAERHTEQAVFNFLPFVGEDRALPKKLAFHPE